MTLVVDVSCRGSSDTRRFLLADGEELVIGRANEELNLHRDQRLSRKHFILKYANRSIEVTHLSKTNPTMVATADSGEFHRVAGKHVETHSCRIIAGSHRFVAVVEAADSVIDPAPSSEMTMNTWSDVDDEPSEDFDFPVTPPHPPESAPAASIRETIVDFEDHLELSDDPKASANDGTPSDQVPAKSLSKPAPPKSSPKPPETKKKMNFPLDEDFFD